MYAVMTHLFNRAGLDLGAKRGPPRRACAAHGERHLLLVRPSEGSEPLVVHEGARVGSRAQQQAVGALRNSL